MGDWSDYFEDFPEENPVNPSGGKQWLPGVQLSERQSKTAQDGGDAEIKRMLLEAWTAEKERSALGIMACPQCGWDELQTYNISGRYYLCECRDCGIYGKGATLSDALTAASDAIGEGLDWREQPPPFKWKPAKDEGPAEGQIPDN